MTARVRVVFTDDSGLRDEEKQWKTMEKTIDGIGLHPSTETQNRPLPCIPCKQQKKNRQAAGPAHNVAMTWAQMAIMPMNSASDASVIASSTRADMSDAPLERKRNLVHDTFYVNPIHCCALSAL